MSSTFYAWVYEDPFHSIFFGVTTVISVLSNSLLLYIIMTTSSSSIGSYRYLLVIFAACDIVTSLAHASIQPYVHMTTMGIYVFPRHGPIMIGGQSYDFFIILVFVATYYQTFLILAYHYVYRLKTVSSGLSRSFTDYWTSSNWTCLGVVVDIIYIALFVGTCAIAFAPDYETRSIAPSEINEIYGYNFQDELNRGFLVIAVRRPDPLTGHESIHAKTTAGLILLVCLFGGTGCVILYCIWKIDGIIRSPGNHLTTKTRKMQLDLFHALLIQSAVPMLFSYFPLAMILVFPAVSGISLGAFGNVFFSITAIFPSIDAFFVLFFIGRFRMAVIRLFRLPFDANNSSSGE